MGDVVHMRLAPLDGAEISPAPWHATNDGSILAADGTHVCVLGAPEDDMGEQDVTNGAAILALPDLIAAARGLHHHARPTNWDDDEDPDQFAAWRALDGAFAKAGIKLIEET